MFDRLRVLLTQVSITNQKKAVNNKSVAITIFYSSRLVWFPRISRRSTLSPSLSGVAAVTFYTPTNLVENHVCRQKVSVRTSEVLVIRVTGVRLLKLLKTTIWGSSGHLLCRMPFRP
jgi:hypothetical protein